MADKQFRYSEAMISDIIALRRDGKTFDKIARSISNKYKVDVTEQAVTKQYRRYRNLFEMQDGEISIRQLRDTARTKRANSKTARENRVILEHQISQEDILEQVKSAVSAVKIAKAPRVPPRKGTKKKPGMIMEQMLTDLHLGKETPKFNLAIARDRLNHYEITAAREVQRYSRFYNFEKVILYLGGDIIENSLMHMMESLVGCEVQNPDQIRYAIEMLFVNVMLPVYAFGLPIHMICVPGNHDRQDMKKTYHYPGRSALTWAIYHTLKFLCERAKMRNITWDIPEGSYTTYNIYGSEILYEHGEDVILTRKSVSTKIADRGQQLNMVLRGGRFGHWHEYMQLGPGFGVFNASLCGADSYADEKGYDSTAGMVINYYVNSETRANPFYHSLLVQL